MAAAITECVGGIEATSGLLMVATEGHPQRPTRDLAEIIAEAVAEHFRLSPSASRLPTASVEMGK